LAIEFTDKRGKLGIYGNKLFIPNGVRMFIRGSYDDSKKFILGNLSTLHQMLIKEAELDHLQVRVNGPSCSYKVADMQKWASATKLDTLRFIIEDCGVFAGQAQQMLKEASCQKTNTATFLLKTAASERSAYGDSKAPFLGGPRGKAENAVTTQENKTQGKALMPQAAIQKATKAAQSGIQEVFDISVLTSLINVADISELRGEYVADMIRGMDKLGRMLFIFYWHSDEFEEKYGSEDLAELEDTLKQVFLELGDLVLFLKEKSGYASDTSESLIGDLSEDLGSAQGETE